MNYFPDSTHIKNKTKPKLEFTNYATKSHIGNTKVFNASDSPKKLI